MIAGLMLIAPVTTTYAAEDITEETQLEPYFTDDEFKDFYDTCKERYEHGEPNAIYEVYIMMCGGGCTEEQIKTVLNEGYLTEFIDELKRSRLIPEEYTLPDDIEIKPTPELPNTVMEEDDPLWNTSEDETQVYVHEVSETASLDAQKIMVDLMNDDVKGNAYVTCPADSEDKRLFGQMLEASTMTGDPLTIYYMDDSHAAYMWYFASILYTKRDYLDLTVNYDGHTLSYDLGDTLKHPAQLGVYVGKEKDKNMQVNLITKDGSIEYTLKIDRDGYITIPEVYSSGNYTVFKEEITTAQPQTTDSTEDVTPRKELNKIAGISNKFTVILMLVLLGLGSGLISYSLFSRKDG